MRLLAKVTILLTCLFLYVSESQAQTDKAKAKVAAALNLEAARRDAVESANKAQAKHVADTLLDAVAKDRCKKCEQERENACSSNLPTAIERAGKEKKALFVWVGMTCVDAPEIRKQFPNVVHCHQDEMNGSKEPRLLVLPAWGIKPGENAPTSIFRVIRYRKHL